MGNLLSRLVSAAKNIARRSRERRRRISNSKTSAAAVQIRQERGQYSDVITSLHSELSRYIEIQYGLLTALRATDCLTCSQLQQIKAKTDVNNRVGQLLDFVIDMTTQQQEKFLLSLETTGQSHVTNYIRNAGQQPTPSTDNWPIMDSTKWNLINEHWNDLLGLIDSRNGLLEDLFSVGFITLAQKQILNHKKDTTERNQQLLEILQYKSVADWTRFVNSLEKTKQCHVAALIEPNASTRSAPLNAQQYEKVEANYTALLELIDSKHGGLLYELWAKDCITQRQKEYVQAAETPSESNTRLLDILLRGSQTDYEKFINCLAKTKQTRAKEILTGDGVVAQPVAKNSGGLDKKEIERCIAEKLTTILQHGGDGGTHRSQINELFKSYGIDIELVAACTGSSIRLFYLCKSLLGLFHLYTLHSDDKLTTLSQQLFTLLLDNGQIIRVDKIVWEASDYYKCARYLCALADLPVYSQLYELAQTTSDDVTVDFANKSSIAIEKLPREMFELVVIKAASQLLDEFNKLTSDADVYTLATLCAVSRYWWHTITCRPRNRRLLKHQFTKICRPHKTKPKLAVALQHIDGNQVKSTAQLSGKLYVIFKKSNRIAVFNYLTDNEQSETFTIVGMTSPSDIVSCGDRNCLFIADLSQHCIRQFSAFDRKSSTFTETPFAPYSISLKSTRMVVVPHTGDALYVYGENGQKRNQFNLPLYMWAHHAVETDQETFVVCHTARLLSDTQPGSDQSTELTELSADGSVLRTYNGPIRCNAPRYLAIGLDSHILVADRRNKQILLLNSELKLLRPLLTRLPGQPVRLSYNKRSGMLCVRYFESNTVSIFMI